MVKESRRSPSRHNLRVHPCMTQPNAASALPLRPLALVLLLACVVLGTLGALWSRPLLSTLALFALFCALMLPHLLKGKPVAWLLWLAGMTLLWAIARQGWADVLLDSLPILINAWLAVWFGRTLRYGSPRVARFIAVIEGPQRLAQPGVAAYARQVTLFWTGLLGAQALLLAVLVVFAAQHGLLARLGWVSPLPIADRWASAWLHLGGYALLAAAFALEYGWRRWRLRHLAHPGLAHTLLQLAHHWPQLVRDDAAPTP